MGNTPSEPPKNFILLPPRIFLQRKDYDLIGVIKAGQLSRRLAEDFFVPPGSLGGGTLLLAETATDDTYMECEADIKIGGATVKSEATAGIRYCDKRFVASGKFSPSSLDLGIVFPFGMASPWSVFSRAHLSKFDPKSILVGFSWKPEETIVPFPNVSPVPLGALDKTPLRRGSFGVSPVLRTNEIVKNANLLARETGVSVYSKIISKATQIFGFHGTYKLKDPSLYLELIAEVNPNLGTIDRSEAAVSWVLESDTKSKFNKRGTPGSMEIALSLSHFASFFDIAAFNTSKFEPIVNFSFFKHLVIPRKTLVRSDSRNKLINNYIDFGFEMAINPKNITSDHHSSSTPSDARQQAPLDINLVGSWQINKQNLVKAKVSAESVSASYTFKTWWKPRFCITASTSYNFITNQRTTGLWFVVDTLDTVEREVSTTSYKDSTGYSIAERIEVSDTDFV